MPSGKEWPVFTWEGIRKQVVSELCLEERRAAIENPVLWFLTPLAAQKKKKKRKGNLAVVDLHKVMLAYPLDGEGLNCWVLSNKGRNCADHRRELQVRLSAMVAASQWCTKTQKYYKSLINIPQSKGAHMQQYSIVLVKNFVVYGNRLMTLPPRDFLPIRECDLQGELRLQTELRLLISWFQNETGGPELLRLTQFSHRSSSKWKRKAEKRIRVMVMWHEKDWKQRMGSRARECRQSLKAVKTREQILL